MSINLLDDGDEVLRNPFLGQTYTIGKKTKGRRRAGAGGGGGGGEASVSDVGCNEWTGLSGCRKERLQILKTVPSQWPRP